MFKFIPVIDRYVSRELLVTWLSVTLVLLLILMSSTLARLLGKAADGSIPADAVFPLLTITGARYLILLVPMSLYLGVLLTFGRMYRDNEMAALAACGIGMPRLYRPLLLVAVPVMIFMLAMTLRVMPDIAMRSALLQAEIENRSELSGLATGQFNQSRDGETVVFLDRQSADGKILQNLFVQQTVDSSVQIETALRAQRYRDEQGRQYILFGDGRHYKGEPGTADYRIVQYASHGIYLQDAVVVQPAKQRNAMTVEELLASDDISHLAELQWRLSIPLATLLLAVLALPLSHTSPRKGRYAVLGLAIFFYLVYSNLLGIGESWFTQGKSPAWLGLWWVHGFALLLIAFWWQLRAGGVRQIYRQLRA
ncbi:MAG: Lipopolysaccharide export system permease protein LptF [Pseudomonadota bacterium]|nr:Lipopolysaccharide export system permease protein LptF [Pseudomonadota bacterium]